MAKKRIQNRVRDIYYVTLEDGARIYLQYVAIDTEQFTFWNLYQKYQKGDRIVKRKGEKTLLLIHHADTACIHLSYKQNDL